MQRPFDRKPSFCHKIGVFCFILFFAFPYWSIAQNLDDRMTRLSQEIRCPVCNGQSVFESDVPEAVFIRHLIEKGIKSGKADGEIRDYLVTMYGEEILLRPEINKYSTPLWAFPFALLALVGGILIWRQKR